MTEPQKEYIITVKPEDDIRLMVPGNCRTCVYIGLTSNGLLTIFGGASIIDTIEGEGMNTKIQGGLYTSAEKVLDELDGVCATNIKICEDAVTKYPEMADANNGSIIAFTNVQEWIAELREREKK